MAQNAVRQDPTIRYLFSPHIGVSVTEDVDNICDKNNLSFVELLKPFSYLTSDVPFIDCNGTRYNLKNLIVHFQDIKKPPPAEYTLKKESIEIIEHCSYVPAVEKDVKHFKFHDELIGIPMKTPWYDSWRRMQLQASPQQLHEYWNHFLGCLFVTSMDTIDPVESFTKLTDEFKEQLRDTPVTASSYPKWFSHDVFHCYLLVCDASRTDPEIATNIFARVQATFGERSCHLLYLNSSDKPCPSADPWLSHLVPPQLPSPQQLHGQLKARVGVLEDGEEHDPEDPLSTVSRTTRGRRGIRDHASLRHGEWLTAHDLASTRNFVFEVTTRSLVPWAERTLRQLNEQAAARTGLTRSFLSATRKLFASTSPSPGQSADDPSSARHAPNSTSVFYAPEAVEMSMRRLADLALIFQQHDLASQMFHTLRRQFQHDAAHLHLASALEMGAHVAALQGATQHRFPYQNVDQALQLYLQECRRPHLALRAVLLVTESLKARAMFSEAETCLFRVAAETDDLTSALMLEQSALCQVQLRPPTLRRFAFRMARAGLKFARAGRRRLTVRAYGLVLPLLRGRSWASAEAHVLQLLGQHSYQMGSAEASLAALTPLFQAACPSQPAEWQAPSLADFVAVLQAAEEASHANARLPELPLPFLAAPLKVMLGGPNTRPGTDSRRASFDDDLEDTQEDAATLSHLLARHGPQNLLLRLPRRKSTAKRTLVPPAWLEGTDVSDCDEVDDLPTADKRLTGEGRFAPVFDRPLESEWDPLPDWLYAMGNADEARPRDLLPGQVLRRLEAMLRFGPTRLDDPTPERRQNTTPRLYSQKLGATEMPIVPAEEDIVLEVPLENRLKVELNLTELTLLWRFWPEEELEEGDRKEVDNECSLRPQEASEFAFADVQAELQLAPEETKSVQLRVTARRRGRLNLEALSLRLHASPGGATVRGKLPLRVRGKRAGPQRVFGRPAADDSEDESERQFQRDRIANVPRERDFRLRWSVAPAMPALQLRFLDQLPRRLLQGQVCLLPVRLANASSVIGLHNLRFAANWPGALIFTPTDATPSDSNHVLPSKVWKENAELAKLEGVKDEKPWQDLSALLGSRVLAPEAEMEGCAWLRAPHFSNENFGRRLRRRLDNTLAPSSRLGRRPGQPQRMQHFIDSLLLPPSHPDAYQRRLLVAFLYETEAGRLPKDIDNGRASWHEMRLEVVPSLRFDAVASRAFIGQADCLNISVQVLHFYAGTPTETARFRIHQVALVSRRWRLERLYPADNMWIGPQGSLSLALRCRALPAELADPDQLCSTLLLNQKPGEAVVQATASPCVDFYRRSGMHWQLLKLAPGEPPRPRDSVQAPATSDDRTSSSSYRANQLDVDLIFFWEFELVPRGEQSSVKSPSRGWGQSHLALRSTNCPVRMPLPEFRTASIHATKQTAVNHEDSSLASVEPKPAENLTPAFVSGLKSMLSMSRWLKIRLLHESDIEFAFSTCSLQQELGLLNVETELSDLLGQGGKQVASNKSPSAYKFAEISVDVQIFNASQTRLLLRLEAMEPFARDGASQLNAASHGPSSIGLPPLIWNGLSAHQCELAPGETHVCRLTGQAARPGVYEANSFVVKAAVLPQAADGDVYPYREAVFVRQENSLSSPVIVRNICTSL